MTLNPNLVVRMMNKNRRKDTLEVFTQNPCELLPIGVPYEQ